MQPVSVKVANEAEIFGKLGKVIHGFLIGILFKSICNFRTMCNHKLFITLLFWDWFITESNLWYLLRFYAHFVLKCLLFSKNLGLSPLVDVIIDVNKFKVTTLKDTLEWLPSQHRIVFYK